MVTWPNGWAGSVTINVVSTGCNGPTAAVTRAVTVNANPTLSYTGSPFSNTAETAISTLTPTTTATSFSGSLPAGLSLNATNGQISGTPNTPQASASYTITGTNTNGCTITTAISIGVRPANFQCATATNLACSTSNLAGTTVGTTGVAHGISGTCLWSGAVSNYGVWYSFTGDGSSTTITVDPEAILDIELDIMSGSCGSYTCVDVNDGGGAGAPETITFTTVSGTNYYVYVAQFSSGGTAADVGTFTISRTCVAPATISTSGTLSSFSSSCNTPSAQQSFTVSGSNLTANITVTAPTGFQVSTTSGSGFASSVTLNQSSGSVGSTIVYVRMAALTASPSNGNIACTSTGAATQNVAVTGTVVSSGISGTVSVGTGQNFTTLTGSGGLFQTINDCGLSGNLIVNITSDLTETGSVALNQWTEIGGSNYTLTIQPDGTTLRTISGTAVATGTPMININGADRVTINGSNKYLLFKNTNATVGNTGPTIQFTNGSINCTLTNCEVQNNGTTSTYGNIVIGSTGTNSVTISSNNLHGATTNPYTCIYSNNASNTLTITNNNIYDFFVEGIYAANVANSAIITGNSFYQTATCTYTGQFVIDVEAGNGHTISNNYIGGSSPTCGGSAWVNSAPLFFSAIYLAVGTSVATEVQGNIIQNINLTNTTTSNSPTAKGNFYIINAAGLVNIGTTSGNTIGHISTANSISISGNNRYYYNALIDASGAAAGSRVENNILANVTFTGTNICSIYGITLNGNARKNRIFNIGGTNASGIPVIIGIGIFGTSGGEISNNMISLNGGTATTSNLYGIYDNTATGATYNIYYNTINIYGTGSSSYSTWGLYRGSTSTSTHNLRNNIIVNQRTGGSMYHYGIYYTSAGNLTSNYNDIYAAGTSAGPVGYYAGTKTTFANWQASFAGCDANSVNVLPTFTSSTDLHTPFDSNCGLDGKGTPIGAVTTDNDGETRNASTPDIGADEIATFAGGTVAATPSALCVGSTSSIALSGNSSGTIQWQQSADGSTGWASVSGGSGGTTATYTTPAISSATYYRVILTGSGTCTGTNSNSAQVTVSNPTITGVTPASNDYVWRGTTSNDWSNTGNWLQYSGSTYSVPNSAPSVSTPVIVPPTQTCVVNAPVITGTMNSDNITILSGATLTVASGGTLNISGSLSNSGTLASTGTINLEGNWVNNGTFTTNTGNEVVFNGNGASTIGGSSANNFYKLSMNKGTATAVTTLASALNTVTNQLTLTSGILDIAGYDLDMGSLTISGGLTSASYVRTSSTGVLKRTVGASDVLFPVGNSAYNPATLNNSGTSDKFSMRVIDKVTDNGTGVGTQTSKAVVNRTWMIDEAVAGGSSATLRLNWNSGEGINSFNAVNAFIAHYESGSSMWDNMGGTVGSGYVSASGLTSFSPWTVSSDGSFAPLPIELTSFQANCSDNNTVDVTWSTASEHNTNYFRVDKSRNGTQWDVLGTIGAAGNSTYTIDYALTDQFPNPGINYYRLTQYDNDGVFETFDVQAAVCKDQQAGTALSTYPNPSTSDFNVDLQTDELEGEGVLIVSDAKGAVVYSQNITIINGTNNYIIQHFQAEPGIYYISVKSGASTVTTKHSLR